MGIIQHPFFIFTKEPSYCSVILSIRPANSDCGNVLLTRFLILQTDRLNLSIPGREPRGAIDAILEIENRPVRLIVTHLGLKVKEGLYQTRLIARKVQEDKTFFLLLIGDINEWYPLSRSLRYLKRCLLKSSDQTNFPARWPIATFDRIWVRPGNALVCVWSHRAPLSRITSDHRPLRALIALR